ncbi:MAG: extracellular solute-binding protein [Candidatus Omnitrophota bacterium]
MKKLYSNTLTGTSGHKHIKNHNHMVKSKIFNFTLSFCILHFAFCILSLGGCTSKKPQEKKITIWHWMSDRKDAFEVLAGKYKEQTGMDVEFKLFFPPDIYSQKVIAAARAGNLPEIFGILGEKKTVGSFVNAGHTLNLNTYMQENNSRWMKAFYPQTLEVVIFREGNSYGVSQGIYGVPIDTTVMQFVYNRSLFEKAGFPPDSPPVTFDEFLHYAKVIKEKSGVDGFVCGWGEGWLLNCLASEWAINLMGEDKFLNTIEGKVPYTDKQWIEVFSLFLKLKDAGILASNIATMTNKEAEDAFSKEKAAFSFNGSWAVNVYKQLAPQLDYAFFSLPQAGKYPLKVWGGAGSSFMVNAKSQKADGAVKFLKWLTLREQQKFLIKETNNLPAIKDCQEDFPPILKNLVNSLNVLTHPNVWPQNEDSRVIEVINRGLQKIVMGLKSPHEVASEIQEVKERISSR